MKKSKESVGRTVGRKWDRLRQRRQTRVPRAVLGAVSDMGDARLALVLALNAEIQHGR